MKEPQACVKQERLFAYSSHTLDSREEAQVRAHLNSCASCRGVVARYANLDTVLEEWKPVEPSPWFDARARGRVASAAVARPRLSWTSFGLRTWTGVAAAVVLVVVTSVIALHPSRPARPGSVVPVKVTTASSLRTATAIPAPTPAPSIAAEAGAAGESTVAQSQPASQEMDLYRNLKLLENYDMLANFDVLSELPQASGKTND
ncbi:MAG: anti-sigma factor family protein [Terriglobia bacterium]